MIYVVLLCWINVAPSSVHHPYLTEVYRDLVRPAENPDQRDMKIAYNSVIRSPRVGSLFLSTYKEVLSSHRTESASDLADALALMCRMFECEPTHLLEALHEGKALVWVLTACRKYFCSGDDMGDAQSASDIQEILIRSTSSIQYVRPLCCLQPIIADVPVGFF